jgi:L-ornithine N5-oxygenase
MEKIFDVVGVGFGPANLSLAIAFEELYPHISAQFFESEAGTDWQSGMMVDRANIQHTPINDLVTLRNPRSKYTFINYLFGRLFEHFDLDLEYPLRSEYAHYVKWVAGHFESQVSYGSRVTSIQPEIQDGRPVYKLTSSSGAQCRGRILVIGTGRSPYIPAVLAQASASASGASGASGGSAGSGESGRVIHLTRYLPTIERFAGRGPASVAVVGAGQSAIEILIDLVRRFPQLKVTSYIRHFAYRLKDTNPFMEACIFPEHISKFYHMSWDHKRRVNEDLKLINYSSADMDVLQELYLLIYEQKLKDGTNPLRIFNDTSIVAAAEDAGKVRITAEHVYSGERNDQSYDLVIAATGFRDLGPAEHQEAIPPLLASLKDKYRFNDRGFCHVNQDYSLTSQQPGIAPVFLNGLCEATHGISDAGTFSLLSWRAKKLSATLNDRLRS